MPSFPPLLGLIPRPGAIGVSHAQYVLHSDIAVSIIPYLLALDMFCLVISWLSVCYYCSHSTLLEGVRTHGCRICLCSQVALAMGFVHMRVFCGLVLNRVLL